MTRRATAAVLIGAVAGSPVSSSRAPDQQAASCFVTIISGAVQGVDRGSSRAFLGIPLTALPITTPAMREQKVWSP